MAIDDPCKTDLEKLAAALQYATRHKGGPGLVLRIRPRPGIVPWTSRLPGLLAHLPMDGFDLLEARVAEEPEG
jgi:hypothetical protein